MKLSKILHVVSILFGLSGLAMWAWILLYWPEGVVWFGATKEVMMFCSITSFLAAIWIQIATIHHMMLEKKAEII